MTLYSTDKKGKDINTRLTKEEYAGIMSEKFRSVVSDNVVGDLVCIEVKKRRGVKRKYGA